LLVVAGMVVFASSATEWHQLMPGGRPRKKARNTSGLCKGKVRKQKNNHIDDDKPYTNEETAQNEPVAQVAHPKSLKPMDLLLEAGWDAEEDEETEEDGECDPGLGAMMAKMAEKLEGKDPDWLPPGLGRRRETLQAKGECKQITPKEIN
jgi:hypothetical protein